MTDLIPIKMTIEMSQDDGRLHEMDVLIGYVFKNRTRTLQKIISEGAADWEVVRGMRGENYFYSRFREPPVDPPANDNVVVE